MSLKKPGSLILGEITTSVVRNLSEATHFVPIYHHKRDSIEAHLTVVMAALAVSRWLERQTGWSIKKIVQTLRPHRSIAVQTGSHILRAGTPLDNQARAIISAVNNAADAH